MEWLSNNPTVEDRSWTLCTEWHLTNATLSPQCTFNRGLHYVNEMKTVQKLRPDPYSGAAAASLHTVEKSATIRGGFRGKDI